MNRNGSTPSTQETTQLPSIRPAEHRVANRTAVADTENTMPARKFQFAAMDRGFGFDAEQLIERSQRLHAHHRGKVTPPLAAATEPVVLNASPTLGSLAKAAAPSTASTAPRFTAGMTPARMKTEPTTAPLYPPTLQAATTADAQPPRPPIQNQRLPETVPQQQPARFHPQAPLAAQQEDGAARPSQAVTPSSTTEGVQPAAQPVGFGRAFCAFAADFCIPFSILISFVVTQGTWQSGFEQTLARLAMHGQTWEKVERFYLWFPWLLPVIAASSLTFLTQYFCGMLGHNSFGRSLCGMHLKKINSVLHIFWIAVFEALSFGGLLALPLLMLMPSRLPLFPWVQFRTRS